MDDFIWYAIAGVILVICMMRAMGLAWWLSTMLAVIALVIVIVATAVAVLWGHPDFNIT